MSVDAVLATRPELVSVLGAAVLKRLEDEGTVAPVKRNQFDLTAAVTFYLDFIEGGDVRAEIHAARTEQKNLENEYNKTKAQLVAGEVFYFADIERVWCDIIVKIRSKLLALPCRTARACVARKNQIIAAILQELSMKRLPNYAHSTRPTTRCETRTLCWRSRRTGTRMTSTGIDSPEMREISLETALRIVVDTTKRFAPSPKVAGPKTDALAWRKNPFFRGVRCQITPTWCS